ncbi:MAG: serpin family protein [Caldisericia bacterium]|nr:serpin family protein [Caldisericia bacterium]
MIRRRSLIILVLALVVAIGIGWWTLFVYPYSPKRPPRADDTGFTKEGVQLVSDGNNLFSIDMYKKLSEASSGNVFYSPYSIFSAMAMAYEGANGETYDEIKKVFHFPDKEKLRPNFAKIYNEINREVRDYELRTGNALWVQKDFPLLEEYKTTVEKYYGGKAANLDFVNETEKSRETINKFIEEQTNGKIKDLISKGILDRYTRLVITNAIYFKGTWKWEFKKSDTRDEDFYVNPKETVKVPMMYMKPEKAEFNYTETEKLQILELPYKGDRISMIILLPKKENGYTLKDVEKELSYENLKKWLMKMQKTKLDAIYIPKFTFKTKYFLKDALTKMGMKTSFSGNADFSKITGKKDLFISNVIHQAFIDVNEKGTEAAAATAIVMKFTAIKPTYIFRADHPFIFIIHDKETGSILFMGRLVNPAE